MRPALTDPTARERFERIILQSALDGRHLPERGPLDWSDPVEDAAIDVLPRVLAALLDAHGLEEWDEAAFEKVFLGEAMRAWHGGMTVERRGNTLVARAPRCPVLGATASDARVCQMCRAVQTLAAKKAYGDRLHGVAFPRLVARGDDACEMHVALGN